MTAKAFDREIEHVARRQHGAFSGAQAAAIGFTDGMVHRRVASGAWLRLGRAVFALPSHPATFLRQCWAAVLAEPRAAVCGLTAAAIHELAGCRPGPIEIVVPPGSNHRNRLARVRQCTEPGLTMIAGLPITTISQTLLDIAPRLGHDALERAVDRALLDRRVRFDQLEDRVARYEGTRRPGLPLFRALVADRAAEGWAPPESELERLLRKALRPLGVRVDWQQRFEWRSQLPMRVDALIPELRVIAEADGRRWHARFKDFDHDRWRDNQVVAHGYRPIRLTWVHLTERPAEVRELLRTIGRAAA